MGIETPGDHGVPLRILVEDALLRRRVAEHELRHAVAQLPQRRLGLGELDGAFDLVVKCRIYPRFVLVSDPPGAAGHAEYQQQSENEAQVELEGQRQLHGAHAMRME